MRTGEEERLEHSEGKLDDDLKRSRAHEDDLEGARVVDAEGTRVDAAELDRIFASLAASLK